MGAHVKIGRDHFPKQGQYLHERCEVLFHMERPAIWGTIVRDDAEEPWETLIKLDDGRVVRSVECQYSPVIGAKEVQSESTPSTPEKP